MSNQNNRDKRVVIFKPNQKMSEKREMGLKLIQSNKIQGIETSLLLDTNALIRIEKAVKDGNKWKDVRNRGLDKFVILLKESPPRSVCPSIGFALNEMPSQNVEFARYCYEEFFAKHLPSFVDTPNSINSNFSKKRVIKTYGFDDLDIKRQSMLFLHYASFIYLNAVYIDPSYKQAVEKFKVYVDLLVNNIDFISTMDLEIAKYCFATDEDNLTNYKKEVVRKNFVKTGKGKLARNIEDIKKIAFNATCDVHLVDAVNLSDQSGLDGVKQDTWIVTADEKLANMFNFFYYIHEGDAVGRVAVSTRSEDHNSEYWSKVDNIASFNNLKRLNKALNPALLESNNVKKVIGQALDYAEKVLGREE